MADTIPPVYETEAGLRQLANYLRSPYGVKIRNAIEHEKRVDYFKGKRLVECLLEAKKWPKALPKITERSVAVSVAQLLIKAQYFHRSDKVEGKKGTLMYSQKNYFEETGYYTWMYAGNMVWSNVATVAVIAVVIGFTLLPIWPDFMKRILWYLSVTFLIVMLVFIFIRLIIFLIFWIIGYEFWIFPRLFDESLTFQESFKPVYTFEKGSPGQAYYRIGLLTALVVFIVWAVRQPSEFDGYIQAQKQFVEDLYSGNLLADVPTDPMLTLDRTRNRVPNLEDLVRQVQEDELITESGEREKRPSAEAGDEGEDTDGADGGEEAARDVRDADEEEIERQAQEDLIDKLLDDDPQ